MYRSLKTLSTIIAGKAGQQEEQARKKDQSAERSEQPLKKKKQSLGKQEQSTATNGHSLTSRPTSPQETRSVYVYAHM